MAKVTKRIPVGFKDKVLMKPLSESENTNSPIIVPDLNNDAPVFGEIIDIGPGIEEFGHFFPTTLKRGDVVIIPKIGSFVVKVDGEEYYITKEREILAPVITIEVDE